MPVYHEGPFRNWLAIHFPGCPDMVSGLCDPQTSTLVEVEQEDGSLADEFSHLFPAGDESTPVTSRRLASNETILTTAPAGLYTGAMRGLVQDLLGRGKRVSYGYTHALTHGLYQAGDDSWWVIAISAAGVRAAPLKLCSDLDAEDTVIGVSSPSSGPPADGWVTLATSSDVAPAYASKAPLWPQCGWAFSASGAKAANVVLSDPDSYQRSHLYEITITGSGTAPTSASMALVSEGYFWGDRTTHVKVPRYANPLFPTIPPSLVSLDWFRGVATQPASSFTSPIHVHYDGEIRRVAEYVFDHDASYTDPDDGSTGTQTTRGFTSEIFPSAISQTETGGPFEWETDFGMPQNLVALRPVTQGNVGFMLDGTSARTRDGEYDEKAGGGRDVLIMPFWDRAAYYHVRRLRDARVGTESSATDPWVWSSGARKRDSGSNAFDLVACAAKRGAPESSPTDNVLVAWDVGVPGTYGGSPLVWRERFTVPDDGFEEYFVIRLSGSCADAIVHDGDHDAAGQAHFAINNTDPDLEWLDTVVSVSPIDDPYDARFNSRWTGRIRRISTTVVSNYSLIRRAPKYYLGDTAGDPRVALDYTDQAIDEETVDYEGGVFVLNAAVDLDVDAATWTEMSVYDPVATAINRILLTAPDSSAAGLRAHLTGVTPQQGSVGELLTGTGVYPYSQVTSIVPSWVGNP